jgi:hypothetical protein
MRRARRRAISPPIARTNATRAVGTTARPVAGKVGGSTAADTVAAVEVAGVDALDPVEPPDAPGSDPADVAEPDPTASADTPPGALVADVVELVVVVPPAAVVDVVDELAATVCAATSSATFNPAVFRVAETGT